MTNDLLREYTIAPNVSHKQHDIIKNQLLSSSSWTMCIYYMLVEYAIVEKLHAIGVDNFSCSVLCNKRIMLAAPQNCYSSQYSLSHSMHCAAAYHDFVVPDIGYRTMVYKDHGEKWCKSMWFCRYILCSKFWYKITTPFEIFIVNIIHHIMICCIGLPMKWELFVVLN